MSLCQPRPLFVYGSLMDGLFNYRRYLASHVSQPPRRARVRGIAGSGYVEYARIDGAGPVLIFARHIAPNSLWPLAAAASLGIGQAIVLRTTSPHAAPC